eukprot:15077681-Alexandrium_andersonii.AAC.1
MAGKVAALVKEFCGVGVVLDTPERREVEKVVEVCKVFFKQQAEQLVQAANGLPVLRSYSSDGTPLHTRARFSTQVGQQQKVVREGGQTHEYLVQQAFLRYIDASGAAHTVPVLRDPLPLTHGKGGWAVFQAGIEFLPTLRQLGHTGISVEHVAFDRALQS